MSRRHARVRITRNCHLDYSRVVAEIMDWVLHTSGCRLTVCLIVHAVPRSRHRFPNLGTWYPHLGTSPVPKSNEAPPQTAKPASPAGPAVECYVAQPSYPPEARSNLRSVLVTVKPAARRVGVFADPVIVTAPAGLRHTRSWAHVDRLTCKRSSPRPSTAPPTSRASTARPTPSERRGRAWVPRRPPAGSRARGSIGRSSQGESRTRASRSRFRCLPIPKSSFNRLLSPARKTRSSLKVTFQPVDITYLRFRLVIRAGAKVRSRLKRPFLPGWKTRRRLNHLFQDDGKA